ncbi:maleylpyruvate isomerase family mycothiol-dependent enzyme [Saccharomonospora azurea]|uniref:maleylpyruvate isomerase family mycothiol-dependent enzyme n=1 Tax=Saccharomonospora azurea TaxID=40988 RepID=UPI003D93EB51
MTDTPRTPRALWPLVHAERAALATDLAELDEARWDTPSLCAGLTVREVLAHLTAGASLTAARWFAGVVRCRFDFDKQVEFRLREQLGSDAGETLRRFRRVVDSTTTPPLPVVAMLGEVVVHGEDIRGPWASVEPSRWTRSPTWHTTTRVPTSSCRRGNERPGCDWR